MCFFLLFYGFICDYLDFPSVKSSKIFTAHRIQRDTNFKHEKSRVCKCRFFDICKFMSITAAKKLVLRRKYLSRIPTDMNVLRI